MNRLEQLKKFAAEEPEDPFNRYALALEFLKSDPKEAARLFGELITTHSDYLPTYYPYAQLLIEQKQSGKAESIYVQGIEVAKSKNDVKTLKELKGAYNDWLYERE